MKISHYTSLDFLALILKNRTIMFNRLDRVDDIEEGTVQSYQIFLLERLENISISVGSFSMNPDFLWQFLRRIHFFRIKKKLAVL